MNKISQTICIVLFAGILSACSSPEEKAAEYVESGKELLEQGNLDKSELEYKNALQINQNISDAWYGLAKIHEARQEWRKAFATLSKVREINPTHLDARIMLAQLLLASNQIDQALFDANEIMEFAPADDARVHSMMAAVQYRLGNHEAAQASVDSAFKISPDNNEAMLVRARIYIAEEKYKQALVFLEKSIASSPDNVSLYLMKIQAYQQMDSRQDIIDTYKTLIQRFPKNVAFRRALAPLYLQAEDVDGTEKVLQEIVDAVPDSVEEKLRLVSFTRRFRSVDNAIALLQGYINQNKKEYLLSFALAELYLSVQKVAEAEAIYQGIVAAEDLQADGLEARNQLALMYVKSNRLDQARDLVSQVLGHDKNNENALLMQAGFKLNDQQFDDAIVDLRTVLRDNPDSIKALGLLGQAYGATGSRELAIETFTKAFQLSPSTPVIANTLARILIQQNNPQQAEEVLESSMKSGNRSLDALKSLAQVKLALGNWEQAEQLAQQLKQIGGQEALSEQVMGIVFQGRSQEDQSLKSFKRAHELAPDAVQPMVAVVQTYVQAKKLGDARRFLKAVIAENGKNMTAFLLMGQLDLIENDRNGAVNNYQKVIELYPNQLVGYSNATKVYLLDNRYQEAEAVTRSGIKMLPENATLKITLASIYERQLKFDQAIEVYESILKANSKQIIAKNNLASLLVDYTDDPENHERARLMSADFRNSKVPQFRDTYAWASVKSGTNLEEAIVILKDVVKENQNLGVYSYHLGEAYRKSNDSAKARIHLQKAIDLEKSDSDVAKKARQALSQLN